MNSEISSSDFDIKVEILKKKYLERRNRFSATEEAQVRGKCGRQKKPVRCSHAAVPELDEVKTSHRKMEELLHAISQQPAWPVCDESAPSSEGELGDQPETVDRTNILCTETDVTLPSNISCTSISFETEPVRFSSGEGWSVYHEMMQIYEKLQARAAMLCEREHELQQREKLFLKHQCTMNRLLTVEEHVLNRINAMQQEHQQEMENLRAALREKTKENKRLKSSFDSIKELNDTMRKQLNEVSEQNTRLESKSRKVQARLENLQKKHEYSAVHRGRESLLKSHDLKPANQDKLRPPIKVSSSSSSCTALKLLPYMIEWLLDGPAFSSEGEKIQDEFYLYGAPCPSLHERCAKVLPVLLEQFQQAEAFLHLPLLRIIYCTLTHLEHSTQHLPLTSTLRRLGEEVNRKSPLFRSSCSHTRLLSSIIILKTLTQGHLPAFLDACSIDQFFHCAAVLLRNPRLNLAISEKLSVLLQKLSCIRKNRRLFESSSLHLLLQETQRCADPSRAFLNINISSILFNLGVASNS
ncbi:coiled-coil domain-containing protein 138 isoform X4 [Tachysurus fulvidraco]|uniref:coiled-coil domain-containing protein 138 isoform X4 n=1 Tax=Tachysurus fulvidraco TaxID=1234273 RepID=UPI001FEF92D6|nr:coiled-coil domain-containing protein 138 isoform X4 [Tachysurus fulvidraco]